MDDRLLYETEQAFVELLLPRTCASAAQGDYIVGHVVPRGSGASVALSDYRLRIEEEGGGAHDVWADDEGEFVIPVSGTTGFRVQCIPPSGPTSLLVYQSAAIR